MEIPYQTERKKEGFVRRAAFVLYVIDELTNQPVKKGCVRAAVQGSAVPIYKPDGWICFMDMEAGEYVVSLEGAFYQKQTILVTVGENGLPTITVRMMPSRLYTLPADTVSVYGKALPTAGYRRFCAQREVRSSCYVIINPVR